MDERVSALPSAYHAADFAKYVVWALLAGAGGAVKFVSASLRNNAAMSSRRFMILLGANMLISGFAGLIGALLFSVISPEPALGAIAAGIFGYMGTQGLDIIALTMSKKITNDAVPISTVIPVPASVDPAANVATSAAGA
jgi:hypothetical protein